MTNKIVEELNKIDVPLELHERSKLGARQAKSDRTTRRFKRVIPVISIAIIVFLVFGISLMSPAVANTLQSIPIVGSIFGMIGDTGLRKAEELGYSKDTNYVLTVDDSTLRITDLIYDGSRLSLGYIVTNYRKDDSIPFPFRNASFKFDNEDFYGGAGSQGDYINETDYAGVHKLIVPNELKKDSFNLAIIFTEFNGKKGSWKLNIPVSKIEGQSFFVDKQTISKEYTIKMKKVTLTPATTELNFDLTEPANAEQINQIIRFRLYDDQGNELEELSAGGGGCSDCQNVDGKITLDTSVQYEPLEETPEYLILEPYISSTKENIEELRMKIPLEMNE